jgi:hypothetical protein
MGTGKNIRLKLISKKILRECELSELTSRALSDACHSDRSATRLLPQRKTRKVQSIAYYTVIAVAF